MDEMAYEINDPDCGRDKNGVFHCVCGKCRPIGFLRGAHEAGRELPGSRMEHHPGELRRVHAGALQKSKEKH